MKLPGVGRRSAERIVFWFLKHPQEDAKALAECIVRLKEELKFCRVCNHLTETEICSICSDTARDQSIICVVEDPKDVLAIEKTGSYRGQYHVLLGNISPTEGRGPEDLKINQLKDRIGTQDIKEVVIATDPDNEGEMTALYLQKVLLPLGIKLSRIGLGIPMGSSVEFADISSLAMSLKARREIHENVDK